MSTLMHFLNAKSLPYFDLLLAFLQQCQAHGGHLVFSPIALSDDNRKSELRKL